MTMEFRKARLEDAAGIARVCSEGWRVTYAEIESEQVISETIREFYNVEQIQKEVLEISHYWNGYFVAHDGEQVVGAGGGGFNSEGEAELYVLYLDPTRKREGLGTRLLEAITKDQVERGGTEQWVSVTKGNEMGIPFYEAVGFEYQHEVPAFGRPEDSGAMSLRYKRKIG